MRIALSGTPVAAGVALGRARIRKAHTPKIETRQLAAHETEAEVARLHTAIAATRSELTRLRERLPDTLAREIAEFLDVHALLLDDPELLAGLTDMIRTGRYTASHALKLQGDRLAAVFDAMDDPYLRARREDIELIINRIQTAMQRGLENSEVIGLAGDVLVSDRLAPAELAQVYERGAVAVLITQGSTLSHSAILARSLGLPMLIVADEVLAGIPDGAAVIVDGTTGSVIVEPGPDDLELLREWQNEQERSHAPAGRPADDMTVSTKDGVRIHLFANAESADDISRAHQLGAEGVGLYRTEFLFLQPGEPPDEELQFSAYRDAVLGMQGKPVTLRTLDLGADKHDQAGISLPDEPNPALGLRGVRLALARPGLFRTQLRAMLRASAFGPVRILVPMVSCREEMLEVRKLLRRCARELRNEGIAHADHVPLGAMIEVPVAAIGLAGMIDRMDFVSVGTNDLFQYLLAADRGNDALNPLFSPLYPAIIQVLHHVLSVCRDRSVPVSICGEIASDSRYTRLLLALGLTEFSMHPGSLPAIRSIIARSEHGALRRRAAALLRAGSRGALENLLARL